MENEFNLTELNLDRLSLELRSRLIKAEDNKKRAEILQDEFFSKHNAKSKRVQEYLEGQSLEEQMRTLIREILPTSIEWEKAIEQRSKKRWKAVAIIFILLFALSGLFSLYLYIIM